MRKKYLWPVKKTQEKIWIFYTYHRKLETKAIEIYSTYIAIEYWYWFLWIFHKVDFNSAHVQHKYWEVQKYQTICKLMRLSQSGYIFLSIKRRQKKGTQSEGVAIVKWHDLHNNGISIDILICWIADSCL